MAEDGSVMQPGSRNLPIIGALLVGVGPTSRPWPARSHHDQPPHEAAPVRRPRGSHARPGCTADAIFAQVTFFAVAFAGATDSAEAMPMLTATGGVLTGDLSAFTDYYGGGSSNQGAPKPDGTGEVPMGTIDPETGADVLDWPSLISGGSFDGFTGVWHFEGTFAANS